MAIDLWDLAGDFLSGVGQNFAQRRGLLSPLIGAGLNAGVGAMQRQRLAAALKGTPLAGYAGQIGAGVAPAIVEQEMKLQNPLYGMKPIPIYDPKTREERFFNPATEGPNLPPGWVSSSFNKAPSAQKLDKFTAAAMQATGIMDPTQFHTPTFTQAYNAAVQQDAAEKERQRREDKLFSLQQSKQDKQENLRLAASLREPLDEKLRYALMQHQQIKQSDIRDLDAKPFGQVVKGVIPFQVVPAPNGEAADRGISVSVPYGAIKNRSDIFFVPASDVQNGRWAQLHDLPRMGEKLKQSARILGKGGLFGPLWQGYKYRTSDPRYQKLLADGAVFYDTAVSAFSRRVSQSLLDQYKNSIMSPHSSSAAAAQAIDAMVGHSKDIIENYRLAGSVEPAETPSAPPAGFR